MEFGLGFEELGFDIGVFSISDNFFEDGMGLDISDLDNEEDFMDEGLDGGSVFEGNFFQDEVKFIDIEERILDEFFFKGGEDIFKVLREGGIFLEEHIFEEGVHLESEFMRVMSSECNEVLQGVIIIHRVFKRRGVI